MTTSPLPLDVNEPGVIGSRSLRALQLVRIGRHTTAVMLVPARGLWVVSGRGPGAGSNGAGKTVLLGALSLLLGDPQWSGGSGTGPNAARLLFDHDRARVTDSTYGSASHGYIAGIFYDKKSQDPLSVWLRIERHSSPHIQVRWENGVHLAEGGSEAVRVTRADAMWNELRSNSTLSVTDYAAKLYGDAPRCIASIRARGSEENQDRSLLALGHRSFRPTDLASQVIMLAGKQYALDAEREQRQALDANKAALDARKKAYEDQYRREAQELAEIERRKKASALSAEAAQAWGSYLRLLCLLEHHDALALEVSVRDLEIRIEQQNTAIDAKRAELDRLPSDAELLRARDEAKKDQDTAIAEKEKLATDAGKNEEKRRGLEARISELAPESALATGVTVNDAEALLTKAKGDLEDAKRYYSNADQELKKAQDSLEELMNGTGGPSGQALLALRAAGYDAASILDLVTLPEADRPVWEARLSPYDGAIIISRDNAVNLGEILDRFPGVPVIGCDGPVTGMEKVGPEDAGPLGDLLRHLGERMPQAGRAWVEDDELHLGIGGEYHPPLTDQEATIAAARDAVDSLRQRLAEEEKRKAGAEGAVIRADRLLSAARAAEEMATLKPQLDQATNVARELPGKIEAARAKEERNRQAFTAAQEAFTNADQHRKAVTGELAALGHGSPAPGSPQGLTQLSLAVAETREKARQKRYTAESLREIAGLADLESAEAMLAESGTILAPEAMREHFHKALRSLRQAAEALLGRPSAPELGQSSPVAGRLWGTSDEAHHVKLNERLQELRDWCDGTQTAEDSARPFDLVEQPLRSWLDWNGADDEAREADIHARRAQEEAEMAAAERKAIDSQLLLAETQLLYIDVIDEMFKNTENCLRELLDSVGQDPVALHARHTDVKDASQWLRWDVAPRWLPPGRKPVEYTNPPNTAELIILHLLLATAALVAAITPRGRMLILDESGNNLDAPNLRRVSQALRQVSEKYGLTVVLACQDLYTDLVAEHSAGVIQLVRSSPGDVLNAPPVIQGDEDPKLVESLEPYLRMGRPETPFGFGPQDAPAK